MSEVGAIPGSGLIHIYGGRAGIDVCLLTQPDRLQPVLALALAAPDTFGIRVLARFPRSRAGRAQADVAGAALAEALETFAWHEMVGGPISYRLRGGTVPGLI